MRSLTFYDLIEAFDQSGCAICRLALRDVKRHLDSLLYEYSTDPQVHRAMRNGRGLCNVHSWQLTEIMGSALNTAVLFSSALLAVRETATMNGSARRTAERLAPRVVCSACQTLHQTEQFCFEVFVRSLDEPTFAATWQASDGLCLPHLRLLLPLVTADQAARLLSHQQTVWRRLQDELEAFQRSFQAEHSAEPLSQAVATSWQRCIAMLTGERSVFGLARHD
ncbi:MAG: DUF6062 family protein [Anaerolineae bacterium]|nr:DUF6062 family protein [Anaerolineae bacterium]MDW8300140.1 DUF6062 family protein [Anaerolineae bacterium]